MRSFSVRPAACVKGKVSFLGDKSIAHRSIICSSLCTGKTVIKNFPASQDCLNTLKALKKLGVEITQRKEKDKNLLTLTVLGKGLYGFKKPKSPIFVGESGTTLRIMLGVLAGQDFQVKILAARSLSQRPMLRVTAPLRMMGAQICALTKKSPDGKIDEYPPITIRGGDLNAINYRMPVASAQVKSAILFAGLYAKGITRVKEPIGTRDHTERMLKLFKAGIKIQHPPSLELRGVVHRSLDGGGQNQILIKGKARLVSPGSIYVPGDISSAGFFMVLASILADSEIIIKNISLNPSRSGIIMVLKKMGANIRELSRINSAEPMGDLLIKSSQLKGITVKKEWVPLLIDEVPILMVAGCFARGKTVFEGAQELRVKETDRVNSMSKNLTKMGARIRVSGSSGSEKIVIDGVKQLKGARVKSFGDHRTAMSMVVAGMAAAGKTCIDDIACVNKSFPNFLGLIASLKR